MKHYVLGFYFTPGGVILIEKTYPEWCRGLCNGLGGSIQSGEDPRVAMAREFYEESDIKTLPEQWQPVIVVEGPNGSYLMHVFWTSGVAEENYCYQCNEGMTRLYQELPRNMERTALWLYLLIEDQTKSGFTFSLPWWG